MREKPIIAIDGPVGVGKSTVAQKVALALDYLYIDTGAMYRTVTLKAMSKGYDLEDREAIARLAQETLIELKPDPNGLRVFCDGEEITGEIRSSEVSRCIGQIADNPQVRQHLVALQQRMGQNGGVVMEGRDITTVVFPDAEIKVYLDATDEERARRRFEQDLQKHKAVTYEETLAHLRKRDQQDRERSMGGLRVAEGAVVLDSTRLSLEEVVDRIVEMAHNHCSPG